MVDSYQGDHSIWSKLYLKHIDSNNDGIFVRIKVGGQIVERQVDTSSVEE